MPKVRITENSDFLDGEREVWVPDYIVMHLETSDSPTNEGPPQGILASSSLTTYSRHDVAADATTEFVWTHLTSSKWIGLKSLMRKDCIEGRFRAHAGAEFFPGAPRVL